jgi:hypothetical protein
VTRKRTKTREELAAIVMERMSGLPECRVVTGVVIAPVLIPKPGHANWHAAFTTKDRQGVPPRPPGASESKLQTNTIWPEG